MEHNKQKRYRKSHFIYYIFFIIGLIFSSIIYYQQIAFASYAYKSVTNNNLSEYLNSREFSKYKVYGSSNFATSDLSHLNKNEKILYTKLKENITEIAEGKRESTEFDINNIEFVGLYESKNTNIKSAIDEALDNYLNNELNIDKVVYALMMDCPYELYWFNKSVGFSSKINKCDTIVNESTDIKIIFRITDIKFKFSVAVEFSQKSPEGTIIPFLIDKTKMQIIQKAKDNAYAIVEKYKSLNDYDKLHAYLDEICNLVTYDEDAMNNIGNLEINGPWQLISVFDEDYGTNVVCEGYSKAFSYLCEISNFENNISCYIVTGDLGDGSHMWNIVTMEDENNYIIDITNCDNDGIGEPDQLFLSGLEGNVDDGYIFTNSNGKKYKYIYDDYTRQLYPIDILQISDTSYHSQNKIPGIPSETPTPAPSQNPTESESDNSNSNEDNNLTSTKEPSKIIISENLKYKFISTNGIVSVQFIGVNKNMNNVVIPTKIKVNNKSYKVTSIIKNAMKNNKKIKKLTIGKNVTSIGENAFRNCKKLKKITVKTKKLKTEKIGKNIFKGISDGYLFIMPSGISKKYNKVLNKLLRGI